MTHPPLPRPRRQPAEDNQPSFRERLAALRYVPPLLGLVWTTHRGFTATMIVLRIARSFIPIAALWVGKLIIDAVIGAREGTVDIGEVWTLVAIEIGIVLVGEVLSRASALVESLLGDLFSNRISVRLMEHAATLDLAQFEDPAFYDHLERARRQTVGRIGLLAQILGMAQDTLTLLTLGAALVAYNPWLLLLLAVAILPSFLGETHFASLEYSLLFRWTPERRQLDYLRFVGASDRTAKEVQMFGLAPWLTERYRRLADRFYEENRKLSIRKGIVGTGLSVFATLGYYGAYLLIISRAVQGAITIGSLTFLAGSFARSRDLIQRLLMSASGIYEQSLYLRDLFLFFEMRATISSPADARPVPRPIRDGFEFQDVGFQYPGSDRWAVRHLSMQIRPGERVALVGENGAGKTTLTKLLARLYDPSEGRILLDGVDLRAYDLADLRNAIGVIFQDFVRFDMRFDENIGVGGIATVQDYLDAVESVPREGESPGAISERTKLDREKGRAASKRTKLDRTDSRVPDAGTTLTHAEDGAAELAANGDGDVPAPLRSAAEKSLAASLLPRFGERYRQMLGRRFENGVDLSGGEWQKIALARAYMRDAQLLILDEPTAALDARAEYEVFMRFSELVAGRMAVLISHRFSTVRMADRIIVLRNGEIVEEGTHEELVARGGLYGELFAMQAIGYR